MQNLAEYNQYLKGPVSWNIQHLFLTEYASIGVELSNTVTINKARDYPALLANVRMKNRKSEREKSQISY